MKYSTSIFITLLILVAVLLPGSSLPNVSAFGIDKLIHFLLFFCWAITLRYDFQSLRRVLVFVFGLAFCFLTEVLQLFTEDRSFDLYDMLADVMGLLFGLLFSKHILMICETFLHSFLRGKK